MMNLDPVSKVLKKQVQKCIAQSTDPDNAVFEVFRCEDFDNCQFRVRATAANKMTLEFKNPAFQALRPVVLAYLLSNFQNAKEAKTEDFDLCLEFDFSKDLESLG